MGKIYNLFSETQAPPATHSVETASKLLPLVVKYTKEAIDKTDKLALALEKTPQESSEFKEICHDYDVTVELWAQRIHRLGAVAKGLWLVDFDTGKGYLCWAYPEKAIEYFHDYDSGYKNRVKIDTKLPK